MSEIYYCTKSNILLYSSTEVLYNNINNLNVEVCTGPKLAMGWGKILIKGLILMSIHFDKLLTY